MFSLEHVDGARRASCTTETAKGCHACSGLLPAQIITLNCQKQRVSITMLVSYCYSRLAHAHGTTLKPCQQNYRYTDQFAHVPLQDTGVFSKKSEAKGVQEQLMTNPDMMQNMMKQQLTGLVPQASWHPAHEPCDFWTCLPCSGVCISDKHVMLIRASAYPNNAAGGATDRHGSICQLFLLWVHHGQDSFPIIAIFQTHASGGNLLQDHPAICQSWTPCFCLLHIISSVLTL